MAKSLSRKLHFSIRTKLFFWFMIEALIVIAVFAVLVRWSFDRGFLEYIASVDEQRTHDLVGRLQIIYTEDKGWEGLQHNRTKWIDLVMNVSGHSSGASIASEQLFEAFPLTGFPKDMPPPLPLRFVLLDHAKKILIGPKDRSREMKMFPVRESRRIVGYVGVLKGPSFRSTYDIEFGKQFSTAVLVAAAGMALLALSLSFALSSRFIKPIQALGNIIRNLASGRYETRVKIRTNDEFSELGDACNDLAEALGKHEQLQRLWIADISHELRTPVSVLRAGIEAVQDGVRAPNPETIDFLHQEIVQLTRIIQDLYDLSLSDTGSLTYQKTKVDIGSIAQGAVKAVEGEFVTKNIRFDFADTSRGHAIIKADPYRLHQTFMNLFRNALRYTDAGGQVRLTISVDSGNAIIDIQDSEPGVNEGELPELFSRFYRGETSRSRDTGGAGLGLAIVKSIVEAHDGTIEAMQSPLGGLHIRIRIRLLK